MQSKIIATIAFSCVPMMGLSQTPPEVWGCDVTRANTSNYEVFESGEATVRLEEGGLAYIRPTTNEVFDENGWQNICDDRDGALQVVLTEYGCNIVEINESVANLISWSVDLESKEAHVRSAELSRLYSGLVVLKFSDCKVTNPLLFE